MLIGQIDVLPLLFGTVAAPAAVISELCHRNTPAPVRSWIADPPPWFSVHADPVLRVGSPRLGPGEIAAIALAREIGAGLLLIDDRAAIAVARAGGMRATGTLGVLMEAAAKGLLDLEGGFAALRATNFRCSPRLLDGLLEQHREGRFDDA